MIVWLDDERDPADGWVWARTAPECIEILRTHPGEVEYLSLDHDLGVPGETGYDVAIWLEAEALIGNPECVPAAINVHTANPVGAANIRAALANVRKVLPYVKVS